MRSGVILSAYVVRIYVSVCVYICVRVLTDRGNGADGRALVDATKWMVRRGGGEGGNYRANWEADGWTGWTGWTGG